MTERWQVENLAKILAILVAEGNYTYVDKIGYAPSKDLLAFYLKEALRDFHSVARGGLKSEKARQLLDEILSRVKAGEVNLDKSVDEVVSSIDDRKDLREISALLSARALAVSARYIER